MGSVGKFRVVTKEEAKRKKNKTSIPRRHYGTRKVRVRF